MDETKETKGMRPIWHFVGLLMIAVGVLLIAAGLYYLVYPSQSSTVLEELHPNLWWGAFMTLAGIVLWVLNRGVRIE